MIIAGISTAAYWQIMPSIAYDLCEFDEWKTGMRREGAIVSVQGLVESVAGGLGAQILGLNLQLAGFDGSLQTQSRQNKKNRSGLDIDRKSK